MHAAVRDAVSHARSSFRHNQRRDPGQGKTTSASLYSFCSGSSEDTTRRRPTCRLRQGNRRGPCSAGRSRRRLLLCDKCSRVSSERRTKLLRLRNIQLCCGACVTTTGPSSQQTLSLSPLSSRRRTSMMSRLRNTAPIAQHCTHDATLCPA